MPHHRYRPAHERVEVPVFDRQWPSRRIDRAPLWVPVDLRDGNQALAEPMDTERKRRMFDMMISLGYKEIEVGYPSASQTDFDFVRHLAGRDDLPGDVTISVFTPARIELIDRTLESIAGLPRVLVHLYTATAPLWRNLVLGKDRGELHRMILGAGEHLLRGAGEQVRFEFSPEVFNLTEPDFVLEVCDSLTELWDACPDRPVTHNLPATVEIATPNVYADQIEYLDRNLARRDSVILSVHPHNDRGTGVACAELAVLAGAQRVEGCLFGNGERTGNVDLVTLALNLYTQGVNPMIDFSDIDAVREVVEYANRLPVPQRHPYVGELVHTAFSGTHQDAIAKGLAVAAPGGPWEVPYLPIDPADLGRDYEAVIRINSQSGKGGVAHLLRTHHGLDLPAGMRPDFSREVQLVTDATGRELSTAELWDLFRSVYLDPGAITLGDWSGSAGTLLIDGVEKPVRGNGNGPLSAFADALRDIGVEADILGYAEHSTTSGPDSPAAAYVHCRVDGISAWGAGLDTSILTASVRAVLSAVNRARS
ncbi:2-isopropylmalate synthase [Pseudonocardiaceae bacterium YIM PH 21723]|nr:2-isopropylmalate synthase [Pseudonocardiaceae bacterium YIM PH 21723]